MYVTVGAALGFADSRNFNPLNFAQQINDHAVTHTFGAYSTNAPSGKVA